MADEVERLIATWDQADAVLKTLADAIATKAAANHNQAIGTITGLTEALAGKMAASKTFAVADLTDVSGSVEAALGYVLAKTALGFSFQSAASLLGNHQHGVADIIGLTAAIDAKIAALVASSPATLDTLAELATALGNDPNFATTIASQIADAARLTTGLINEARLPARLRLAGIVSQALAEAGEDNELLMTSLRTKQAISALASSGGINIVTFTSSGSYVPSAKLKWAEITVIGGGGGWGNYSSSNIGGAGGGAAIKKVKAADLAASNAVVIGAGGALNTNGGNSSITLPGGTITGGGGGSGYSAGYVSTGGIGSGGDRNFKGSNGTSGVVGASSFDLNVTDLAAANWGYGHGGSSANAAKAGVVIIEEHF